MYISTDILYMRMYIHMLARTIFFPDLTFQK